MVIRPLRPGRLVFERQQAFRSEHKRITKTPEAKRHGLRLFHFGPCSRAKQRRGSGPRPPKREKQATTPGPATFGDIWTQRKWPLMGLFGVSFLIGLYPTVMVVSSLRTRPEIDGKTAQECDAELDSIETQTGIRALRANLASRARGHVLEVAIGTGRSLRHYEWDALVAADRDEARRLRVDERVRRLMEKHGWTGARSEAHAKRLASTLQLGDVDGELLSLTAVDISPERLSVAQERLRECVPGLDGLKPHDVKTALLDVLDHRLRLVRADAQHPLPPPPHVPGLPAAPTYYDTVTQSFGLCSVEDPVRVLAQMAAVVRPDTGRILLVEHGRCFWDWLNAALLDRFADHHFRKYGCYWNRDMPALVEEAVAKIPGLELVSLERPYRFGGTTVLVELKVKSDGGERLEEAAPTRSGWMGLWDRWKSTRQQ